MADKKDDTEITDAVKNSAATLFWAKAPAFSRHSHEMPVTWSRKIGAGNKSLRIAEWYVECTLAGSKLLEESVDVDPQKRSGRAVIKGTGFAVSQVLIELADSSGPKEVAENFDLDQKKVVDFLSGLAMLLSKPFGK